MCVASTHTRVYDLLQERCESAGGWRGVRASARRVPAVPSAAGAVPASLHGVVVSLVALRDVGLVHPHRAEVLAARSRVPRGPRTSTDPVVFHGPGQDAGVAPGDHRTAETRALATLPVQIRV